MILANSVSGIPCEKEVRLILLNVYLCISYLKGILKQNKKQLYLQMYNINDMKSTQGY